MSAGTSTGGAHGRRLGVTVGKFYPLHRGHAHLIRTAAAAVDHLVVVVGDAPGRLPDGETRAAWIRELFPEVEVVVTPEDIPGEPEPWAARTLALLGGRRPDVAYTSEAYGAPWAAAMGCRAVTVDQARRQEPISGTALRRDLAAHWHMLTAPARAHYARRVCVLGVESSGSTTLATALAAHYRTAWVPEFGRYYWEGRRHCPESATWDSDEFLAIARQQIAWEDTLARRAQRLLVCDTDALATHVWHRRYVGHDDPRVLTVADSRHYDLYLLTAPDFPFVQDGSRDGEHIRHEMHGWFLEQLSARGTPYVVLTGSPDVRLAEAVAAVDPLLRFPALP